LNRHTGESRYPATYPPKKRSGKGENELTVSSKFRHSGENRNPLGFSVFDWSSLEDGFFCFFDGNCTDWIPAFAGMTSRNNFSATASKSPTLLQFFQRKN